MKCVRCKRMSIIKVRGHNFCSDCFKKWYERSVEKTIKNYKMIYKKDKVLASISGGKDSAVMLYVLKKMKFSVEALHINLGIDDYSYKSLKYCDELCEKLNVNLNILNISEYGLKIKRIGSREECSVCGTFKRYLLNKFAYDNNYDVVVMGHTLDDECANLLSNLMRWSDEYLSRQNPSLPSREKLVRRVKPLSFQTEKENGVYALLNNIPYYDEECPYSKNAPQIVYKRSLNLLEDRFPGIKYTFYKNFLKKRLFEGKDVVLIGCQECGMPTTSDICTFCKLRKYLCMKKN